MQTKSSRHARTPKTRLLRILFESRVVLELDFSHQRKHFKALHKCISVLLSGCEHFFFIATIFLSFLWMKTCHLSRMVFSTTCSTTRKTVRLILLAYQPNKKKYPKICSNFAFLLSNKTQKVNFIGTVKLTKNQQEGVWVNFLWL